MAKLSSEELEEIVKQSLPGYRISRRSQVAGQSQDTGAGRDSASAKSEADHLKQLRRKYLGPDFSPDDDDQLDESDRIDYANGPVDDNSDDAVIVAVEPETAADPLDRSARAKAAVISKKEKRIIGQQG